MTGQVNFDSHVLALLTVAVRLVNELTPGQVGARTVEVPLGRSRVGVVAEALSGSGRRPRVTQDEADRFVGTAADLRAVFESADEGHLDGAAARVNALLATTQARPQLDKFPDGRWSLHFHGADDSLVVGWAAGCASALALALGSDLAGRLGVCDAPSCDRVYVDESKNGTRRFCSARCQSRVKAAAHRSRQG